MSELSPQQRREHAEPHEGSGAAPRWVLALAGALGIFGVVYIMTSNPDTPARWGDGRTPAELARNSMSTAPDSIDGAGLFVARCAACHQADGAGLTGVFPPLARSEWVNGPPGTLIAIVLSGVAGEITVRSQKYNGMMPPFAEQLSDAEMAALLTYLRSAWGNDTGAVTADVVSAIRATTAGRGPFQGEAELTTFER